MRKVAARAGGHLATERPRCGRDAARREAVTRAVVEAVDGADLDALREVLAPDVVFVADGGGVVAAARHPQHGADRGALVIISLARLKPPDWTLGARELNGEPGFTVHRPDGTIDSAWILHAVGDRVARIDVLRNPAKLAGLG